MSVVIPEKYPPLREWMEKMRQDIALQRAVLDLLESRLALYQELLDEVMREKEGHSEH